MYACIYMAYMYNLHLGQPRELNPDSAVYGESTGQGQVRIYISL